MYLIIGGAYQGKLKYAKKHFSLSDDDIFECVEKTEPDFSCLCINHIERYVLFCLRKGIDPIEKINNWIKMNGEGVIICEDVFCGVVPTDAEIRNWREETGRFVNQVSENADGVIRIFCGLPQVLK